VLLVDSLFVEPNPQPIKKAMELLGLCSGVVRLPLTECSAETTQLLQQQLVANDLLPQ
jgi:4-hydroxy-tetrahydrodipicolinate synthase